MLRILCEVSYQYGKLREAENEKKLADAEYKKQHPYFDNNFRLKEVIEGRKSKADRALSNIRSEYIRLAKDTEPMLRRLRVDVEQSQLSEDSIQKAIKTELNKFVTYKETENMFDDLNRRITRSFEGDVRGAVQKELRNFTRKADFQRLEDQVDIISLRAGSVQKGDSQDSEHRIVAHERELEQMRTQMTAISNHHTREISALKDKLSTVQNELTVRALDHMQMATGAKSDDVIMVVVLVCI